MNSELNKLAIICVCNDKKKYDNMLGESLIGQNIDFEMILIDNSDGRFTSAAEALNYGAECTDADILVFSHQDIYLKTKDALKRFAEAIEKKPVGCIIGTTGVKEPSKEYFSNITYGDMFSNDLIDDYNENDYYPVSCVDECFFGMKRKTWAHHKFDNQLCNNWHLYCVEECLWNRKNGGGVYVYPIQLHHFSIGTITWGYMKNLKMLCKVYRSDFKYIWTTCYKVRTNRIYINFLYMAWVINRFIRGNLK